MTLRLSITIPTRGRPDNLRRTVEQTLSKIVLEDTRLLIAIDDDDQATIDRISDLPKDDRVIISVKPREDTRGGKTDRLLLEAPADLYLVGHDSAPIATYGFDQMFINGAKLFDDGIVCVCSRMANASFPQLQAVTQKWVDIVGYIYNPAYPFWFIDHDLDDIARMSGRVVYTEVECSIAGMRPAKTIRLRDLRFWIDYYDALILRRRRKAWSLIDAIDVPESQRMMLRTWCHPVEVRSESIHYQLRPIAENVEFGWTDQATGQFHEGRGEGGEPDPGYIRAFERARQDLKAMEFHRNKLHQEAA